MSGKIVLITGASSGIGKAAAVRFLKQDYTVYGAARTEADLEYLSDYPNGHYILMDITEAKQFEVNLFGLSELTKLVIPGMREKGSGRIINISSIAGKIWTPLGGWYHASKFALEGLSDCLRNELRQFGIDVILIEPGAIETNWAGTAGDNLLENSGEGIYQKQAERKANKYKQMYGEGGMAASPEVVAEAIFKAAETDKPKARYAVPAHAKLILFFRWLLPDSLYDFFTNKFF
jgi:short-subunit dehydrogenase